MAVFEIDQSGKWEEYRNTVIGVSGSDGAAFSVLVRLPVKTQVMTVLGTFFQERNRSKKIKVVRFFAYTIFLAIRDAVRLGDVVVIDQEYEGNEQGIRDLLRFLFKRFRGLEIPAENIQFSCVGKQSLSHIVAYQTFAGTRKAERELGFDEFYSLLDRTAEIRGRALRKRLKRNSTRATGFPPAQWSRQRR